MDQIDLAIISQLRTNGRKPFTEIAKELSISEGTVRNRVAKLVEDQAVQIVGLVDPYSLGFTAPALIGVTLEAADVEAIAAEIARYEEVSYLVLVSGEFDFLIEVMCRDREHLTNFLNQRLRRIPGVSRTRTFMILNTYKMAYGAKTTAGGREMPVKDSEHG